MHVFSVCYTVLVGIESRDLADDTPVISLVNIVTILRAPVSPVVSGDAGALYSY